MESNEKPSSLEPNNEDIAGERKLANTESVRQLLTYKPIVEAGEAYIEWLRELTGDTIPDYCKKQNLGILYELRTGSFVIPQADRVVCMAYYPVYDTGMIAFYWQKEYEEVLRRNEPRNMGDTAHSVFQQVIKKDAEVQFRFSNRDPMPRPGAPHFLSTFLHHYVNGITKGNWMLVAEEKQRFEVYSHWLQTHPNSHIQLIDATNFATGSNEIAVF
jgi:hypothetical protein